MRLALLVLAACGPIAKVGAPCKTARAFAPFDEAAQPTPRALPPSGVLDAALAAYQSGGRAPEMPGTGCPFAPTCSSYARGALEHYGAAGVFLVIDRLLVRAHLAAGAYYPTICIEHTMRLSDAVP